MVEQDETVKTIHALNMLNKMAYILYTDPRMSEELLKQYINEMLSYIKREEITPIGLLLQVQSLLNKVRVSTYSLVQSLFVNDDDMKAFLYAMNKYLPVKDVENVINKFIKEFDVKNIDDLYVLTGVYLITSTFNRVIDRKPKIISLPHDEKDLQALIMKCLKDTCKYFAERIAGLEAFRVTKDEILKLEHPEKAIEKFGKERATIEPGMKAYIMSELLLHVLFETDEKIEAFVKEFEERFPYNDIERLIDDITEYVSNRYNMENTNILRTNVSMLLVLYLLSKIYLEIKSR